MNVSLEWLEKESESRIVMVRLVTSATGSRSVKLSICKAPDSSESRASWASIESGDWELGVLSICFSNCKLSTMSDIELLNCTLSKHKNTLCFVSSWSVGGIGTAFFLCCAGPLASSKAFRSLTITECIAGSLKIGYSGRN